MLVGSGLWRIGFGRLGFLGVAEPLSRVCSSAVDADADDSQPL